MCSQKLNQELEEAMDERDVLKTQVQQYILEVRRIEDALGAKVHIQFTQVLESLGSTKISLAHIE